MHELIKEALAQYQYVLLSFLVFQLINIVCVILLAKSRQQVQEKRKARDLTLIDEARMNRRG